VSRLCHGVAAHPEPTVRPRVVARPRRAECVMVGRRELIRRGFGVVAERKLPPLAAEAAPRGERQLALRPPRAGAQARRADRGTSSHRPTRDFAFMRWFRKELRQ
jgi:hypothetical protein